MLLDDPVYPPPKVAHVIFTRYNLRVYRGKNPDTKQYLQERFPQFRDYCFSSIVANKKKPHRWFIGFDSEEPEAVQDVLDLISPYPWIQPVWQENNDKWTAPFSRAIEPITERFELVATTRVDNDDAISVYFLRTLEEYIRSVLQRESVRSSFWVSFPFGVYLKESAAYIYMHPKGHFNTRVIARGSSRDDVHSVKHFELFKNARETGERVYLPQTQLPMWLENAHGNNIHNHTKTVSDYGLKIDSSQEIRELFALPNVQGLTSG